ncbi:MAG TPA: hypothetical protein DHI91_01810 [Candidatus Portnoybacteria bacterium]|nr:hypothetical protein [Candidatus Portnoybacteria bacterium]
MAAIWASFRSVTVLLGYVRPEKTAAVSAGAMNPPPPPPPPPPPEVQAEVTKLQLESQLKVPPVYP